MGPAREGHAARTRANSGSVSGAGLVKARSPAQDESAEESSGVTGCVAMLADFGSAGWGFDSLRAYLCKAMRSDVKQC